jgi:hypothetical protein
MAGLAAGLAAAGLLGRSLGSIGRMGRRRQRGIRGIALAAGVGLAAFAFPVGDAAAQALHLDFEVGHLCCERRNALIALPTPQASRGLVMQAQRQTTCGDHGTTGFQGLNDGSGDVAEENGKRCVFDGPHKKGTAEKGTRSFGRVTCPETHEKMANFCGPRMRSKEGMNGYHFL